MIVVLLEYESAPFYSDVYEWCKFNNIAMIDSDIVFFDNIRMIQYLFDTEPDAIAFRLRFAG